MKSILHLALAMALICAGGLLVSLIGTADAAPVVTSEAESLRMVRPGYLYSHTTISVTNISAASSALQTNSVYRLICSDDVYYDQGTSTVAATTSEAYLPADTVEYIRTTDTVIYVAAIRKTNNCTCYLAEIR